MSKLTDKIISCIDACSEHDMMSNLVDVLTEVRALEAKRINAYAEGRRAGAEQAYEHALRLTGETMTTLGASVAGPTWKQVEDLEDALESSRCEPLRAIDDHISDCAERAEQRAMADYYGGNGPVTPEELMAEARKLK